MWYLTEKGKNNLMLQKQAAQELNNKETQAFTILQEHTRS